MMRLGLIRDVGYNVRVFTKRKSGMFQLRATAGVTCGTSWPIQARPLVIGRESGCEVKIPDPVVSRRHCEISLANDTVNLRTLSSRNPVFVNGKPSEGCTLQIGDEIRVGRAVFFIASGGSRNTHGSSDETEDLPGDVLAEEQSVYLSTRPVGEGVKVVPQTEDDFHELFRLSRSLSRVTSQAELIKIVGNALKAHFHPDHSWLLLNYEEEERLVTFQTETPPPDKESVPPPRRLMMSSLRERKGTLVPEHITDNSEKTTRFTMVAPIFFGDRKIGSLAFQRKGAERAYTTRDLHFFVALAHIAAPFFKAIERIESLETENERLRLIAEKTPRLVGSSKTMRRLQSMIATVAPSMHPVLIQGATGTGKELVAGLIHELSDRANGPMVIVNCAAIPGELFEGEFFGHERGAFTGATERRIGLLEQSDGGSLFLDEIGDLSLEHQARILRAIETGQFRRVGGKKEIKADFRVIAATNKKIAEQIRKGAFREDLFHRLNGVMFNISPLSQRRHDIPELAQHFLDMACAKTKGPQRRFAPEAIQYMLSRAWPGNVRELKYAVEAANIFCRGDTINIKDLQVASELQETEEVPLSLEEIQRRHIKKVIEYTDGNMQEAARILGIGRSTLYNKLGE